MSLDQTLSIVGGLVALVVGLSAIVRRKIAVGEDEFGDSNFWVYGWRAIAVGCLALVVSALFFASAVGLIHLNWSN